jgi:hypothetical protein
MKLLKCSDCGLRVVAQCSLVRAYQRYEETHPWTCKVWIYIQNVSYVL